MAFFFDNFLCTHQVLIHVVIVIHKSVPVPEVGVEPTISRCEFFLVKAEVPLADNARFVAQVLEVLWQQFSMWQGPGFCSRNWDTLHSCQWQTLILTLATT